MSSAIASASTQFANQFIASGASGNFTALETALTGRTLSYPFWYSEFNLAPFDQLAVGPPFPSEICRGVWSAERSL
jgi:hypothetical protein